MSNEFVQIANFEFLSQAELMKHLLENEGFEVILDNEVGSNINFLWNAATGWPSLKVSPKDAESAARFIEKHREAVLKTKQSSLPDVTFDCDECGKSMTFPGTRRGGVEDCPHCKAFVDVPD